MRTQCKSPIHRDVSWTKHAHTQHVIHVQLHPQVMMQEDMTFKYASSQFGASTLHQIGQLQTQGNVEFKSDHPS